MGADNLNIQLDGHSDPITLYNIACCLAVAARDQPALLSSMLGQAAKVASANHTEPPSSFNQSSPLVCKALDTAVRYLLQAVAAGYDQDQHAASDPDLSYLRQHRPREFTRAMQVLTTM